MHVETYFWQKWTSTLCDQVYFSYIKEKCYCSIISHARQVFCQRYIYCIRATRQNMIVHVHGVQESPYSWLSVELYFDSNCFCYSNYPKKEALILFKVKRDLLTLLWMSELPLEIWPCRFDTCAKHDTLAYKHSIRNTYYS